MNNTTPDLGRDVDAYCGRCRMILAHTITAKMGDRIVRVICNTCKAEHGYRPGPGSTAARRRSSSAEPTKRPKSRARPSEFARLVDGRDTAAASDYSPVRTLSVTELVRHPKFGVGVVSALKSGGKAEVVFDDAVRVLVHARG